MEKICSRKHWFVRHLRLLGSEREYREEQGQFVCDGEKMLREALSFGGEVVGVLWRGEHGEMSGCGEQFFADEDIFEYASPLKNSPGPVFAVRMPQQSRRAVKNAIVLENVQDPGNVGTVLRTASALEIDAVILTGACAELYNPKTVRATMGAIFRQYAVETGDLAGFLSRNGLLLYGAALSDRAVDIRSVDLKNAAVAIGNEGRGLTKELLDMCRGQIIIPMSPDSESLNAGIAAGIVMWEMVR